MTALLIYLIKVIACSGLFYLYYMATLRNRLFHHWNRFYLLAAIIASLCIPLIQWNVTNITNYRDTGAIRLLHVVGTANNFLEDVTGNSRPALSSTQWAVLVYIAVSFVLLAIFLRALARIFTLVRSHTVQRLHEIRFVNTNVAGTPFSFLHYIFWNEAIDPDSPTGQQIFQHELVHVQERHSWDKLFIEIILIIFWCNPFFWLMRRELKQVHEFIADRRSVGENGTAAFAAMILQAAYPRQYSQLIHPFFQTSIKRRIHMLTKNQKTRFRYFSRILVLPLFLAAVLAFTVRTQKASPQNLPLAKTFTVVIDAGHGLVNNEHTGARADGFYEDEIVLALAKKIQSLNSNQRLNIVLSRTGDQDVDLKKRVDIAVKNNADLFISLHTNIKDANTAAEGRSSGIELYVPKDIAAYQAKSELLASALQQELQATHKTYPGLLKHTTGVWVLDHNVCPSVLIECGYITDGADRDFFTGEKNQQLFAERVLAAIQRAVSQ
jgi:N-acetylmuramoyl-L-alanine amidase